MLPSAPLAIFSLAVMAQGLPDPKSAEATGWLILALAGLSVAANQVAGFVVNFRKLRGTTPEEAGRWASNEALATLAGDLAETRGRVSKIESTQAHELQAIHRALGRIEGSLGTR